VLGDWPTLFVADETHHLAHQSLQLDTRLVRKPRLRQRVLAVAAVGVEQPPEESDHRNALQLIPALRGRDITLRPDQRLESMCVAQRLCRERRDRLTEPDIRLGERTRVLLRSQRTEEDRADNRAFPPDGQHDDRAHIPHRERRLDALEHRLLRGVGDEDGLTGLEGAFQLGVPVEIDDQVPDRRVLVARDEPDFVLLRCEKDRATIEAERLAELARDALENVDKVEGGGDLRQDVDDGGQLIALALQLGDPRAKSGEFVRLCARRNALQRALKRGLQSAQLAARRLAVAEAGRLERRPRRWCVLELHRLPRRHCLPWCAG
jgi:hypothetical protein